MRQDAIKLASDLRGIVARIRKRQPVIDQLRAGLHRSANEFLSEVVLQGHDLLAAKARVKFGDWMDYVAANIPEISHRTATDYMRIAANWQHAAKLQEAKSQRQALQLCAGLEEIEQQPETAKKHWPAYIEGLGRANKLLGYLQKNPINKWPEEGRQRLKEDLEPLVVILWPDHFPARR
jgi:hypothetical protein